MAHLGTVVGHGEAVGAGMVLAARLSQAMELITSQMLPHRCRM